MTAVVANLLVADIAVSSDNREELLGIDPLTQGCRADDVDKCHGELPAFGMQSFILDIRRRLRPLKSARTIGLRLAAHDPPCSVLLFLKTSAAYIGLENIAPDTRLPQGCNWMWIVLWQYGRFDEDAVPWRRLERVEDKLLLVERIDKQSA